MRSPDREAAIVRMFPVVKTIAHAVYRQVRCADFDDLVGDGALGLIAAVDGYDPARGMSFERYTRRKILHAMLDGVRRADDLSQLARRVLVQAERDRFAYALQLGRMPSASELEGRHPKLRAAQCTAHVRRPLSLDTGAAIDMLLRPDWRTDPGSILCARERERSVSIALDRLPARHRELLGMYYVRGLRLGDLAQRLSLTKQRVAQLRDSALASVREEVMAS